jgi:predicted nucleic acid-binding protein
VFERIDGGSISAVASTVTLVELLTGPLFAGDIALAERHKELFLRTSGFSVAPVTPSIAERAAEVRAQYRLRTPDAIIVASALEADCDAIISNDDDWKRRITEIRILHLEQFVTGGPA